MNSDRKRLILAGAAYLLFGLGGLGISASFNTAAADDVARTGAGILSSVLALGGLSAMAGGIKPGLFPR